MEQDQPTSIFEMQADSITQNHLNSISRWGKFISITGFIFAAIFLLVIAVRGEQMVDQVRALLTLDDKLTGIILAILIVIGVLCLAWLYFLLRACILIKQGLVSSNSDRLAEGFKALKGFFVVSLIFSILFILGDISRMINA